MKAMGGQDDTFKIPDPREAHQSPCSPAFLLAEGGTSGGAPGLDSHKQTTSEAGQKSFSSPPGVVSWG